VFDFTWRCSGADREEKHVNEFGTGDDECNGNFATVRSVGDDSMRSYALCGICFWPVAARQRMQK